MQRNRIQKIFDAWRKENRHRFTYPMYVTGKRQRGVYVIVFEGIAPEIRLHFSGRCFSLWAHVKVGESGGDGLVEFDLQERRHPVTKKYYCVDCHDYEFGVHTYFDTRRELWTQHSFEPLLEWMNENFQAGKWLCLYGDSDWIWNARILDEITMLQHRDNLEKYDFYCAVPVVKPKGEQVIVRKKD